ncbi:sesquipedalian-1 isoform X1 [Denticeps clupeoides]|nr:sesquipedalian-1 isoform X1 [Denticeps clupeoides]
MKLNERSVVHYATCDSPPDKTGFLFKKGERNTAYHRRWFILKGNLLFYFEERESREPIGVIVLEGCTVELCESAEEYAFAIKFDCAKARVYKMAADSQAAMESWVKALSRASFEYMRLVVRELEKQLDEVQGRPKSARKPLLPALTACSKPAASSTTGPPSSGQSLASTAPHANSVTWNQAEDMQLTTGPARENGVAWNKAPCMSNGCAEGFSVPWEGKGDGFRPPPLPPRRRGGSGSLESPVSPETECFSKLHDWYGMEVAKVRTEWLQNQ